MDVENKKKTLATNPLIKSEQVKTTTHFEILDLGEKIFEKATMRQRKVFEKQLLEHERSLVEQLQRQYSGEVKILEERHQKNIENIQKRAREKQDKALKEEADRVRGIMTKVAEELVDGTVSEGQKKIDVALKKARAVFDNEKQEALEAAITQQKHITDNVLQKRDAKYRKDIENLSQQWMTKMENLRIEHSENLKKVLADQTREIRIQFNIELASALAETQLKHESEVQVLDKYLYKVKNEKKDLEQKILLLENQIIHQKEVIKTIKASFQKFVEGCSGFHEGQSDFLLAELVPEGFPDFVENY